MTLARKVLQDPLPSTLSQFARALGLVLQVRTSEVLRATGLFNELHAKQMLSMAGAEAFRPEAFGVLRAGAAGHAVV